MSLAPRRRSFTRRPPARNPMPSPGACAPVDGACLTKAKDVPASSGALPARPSSGIELGAHGIRTYAIRLWRGRWCTHREGFRRPREGDAQVDSTRGLFQSHFGHAQFSFLTQSDASLKGTLLRFRTQPAYRCRWQRFTEINFAASAAISLRIDEPLDGLNGHRLL